MNHKIFFTFGAACVLALLLMAASVQAKVYFIDIDFMMQLNCTNPVARVDGTPLLQSEIDAIQVNVYNDMQIHTIYMNGGCALTPFDLSVLTAGTWNKEFMTIDTGGRVSAIVQGKPFEYETFVAAPNPPTIIEEE